MCRSASSSKRIFSAKFPLFTGVFLLFLALLSSVIITPRFAFAYSQIAALLCENGIKDLKKGDLLEAEQEFNKALLAEPGYPPAIYYLQLIHEMTRKDTGKEQPVEPAYAPAVESGREAIISTALDREAAIKNALEQTKMKPAVAVGQGPAETLPYIPQAAAVKPGARPAGKLPARYFLNDPRISIQQPIQIEEGKYIIISGSHIQRFLVVQPELLAAEKLNDNELSVIAKNIGPASIIIWDDNGRTNIDCTGIIPIPETPTLEEVMRKEEERMGNFRLRYNLDWYSYYTGSGLSTIERSGNYSWIHNLSMDGATPYGLLDSAVTVRTLSTTTDMTYVTAGLTNGQLGDFKGFSIRAGDYNPYFNNLAMPGADLRGVYFYSPAFNNKLDYTIFWGRENGGRYGTLVADSYKSLNSFISGFNMDFSPLSWQNYKFTIAHGEGRDRQSYLKSYAYDLIGNWNFKNSGLSYEIASDTENLAQLLTSRYNGDNFNIDLQLRDIDKQFVNITNSGWRQGEFGTLLNLNYRPTDKLTFTQRADLYRDRLYPAEDNPDRFNEDLDSTLEYKLDPLTSLEATYTLQNDLGKLAQTRYQSPGIGANRLFSLFGKEVSVYSRYSYQDNKSFTSPNLDYTNAKIFGGFRFSIVGALYYYLNKEWNWLTERTTGNHEQPNVMETGVDWYNRIGSSPFSGALRFTYRDEERANSPLSFLSGQDYIEGYSELSYHPSDAKEIYASCRVRNVWKENPATAGSRVEASFNVGMKLLWDTKLRWDAVSTIYGYVFKDYNSDGLKGRDEPPVSGIKIWLGKKQSRVTDESGYFKFGKVRGKKAYVTLDTATLPAGYMLTVSVTQEIPIVNGDISEVYFGIISRSEIRGMVFEDADNNGEYSAGEKGVSGVSIILDGTKTVITDLDGRYAFLQAQPGEHELSADLNTIPIYYLPAVAIKKKFPLQEGESSVWNISLGKIQK